ncbi:MAG: tRNA 2-thiocytidine(32) synthetase TtcA [Gammaproteobacteria bacterium]|nr:tRNA 2-thiocytidine(32) synthetase TtcA [Gammaproteobacteria bacterium]MDD9960233.1 tRNA 2-thiocytidine(32) synthetase TtcA [Gammaproteobacteria bacterium]
MKTQSDQLILNRSRKNLRRDVGHAIADFIMIEDGDLVMVCLSGGKDSYTLLDILRNLQKHAPIEFKIHAVNLDQKQPGFPEEVLPDYLDSINIDYKILQQDTYSIVTDKVAEGKTYCGLCSRLRRGILYNYADSIGADKIALGHHREDIVETLFLNMFYGGKLKAMPPKLLSDDKRNVVIRPLAYCKESEISRYAELMDFPIIPCNLCGSQDNLQRQAIKAMLQEWEKSNPGRIETIFRSIANVSLSQLADISQFPFQELRKASSGELQLDVVELV